MEIVPKHCFNCGTYINNWLIVYNNDNDYYMLAPHWSLFYENKDFYCYNTGT